MAIRRLIGIRLALLCQLQEVCKLDFPNFNLDDLATTLLKLFPQSVREMLFVSTLLTLTHGGTASEHKKITHIAFDHGSRNRFTKDLPDPYGFLVARTGTMSAPTARLTITEVVIRRQATMLTAKQPEAKCVVPTHLKLHDGFISYSERKRKHA